MFAQTVRRYKQRFDADPDRLNTDSLLNTLKNRITGHTLKSDLEMIPYLRGEKEPAKGGLTDVKDDAPATCWCRDADARHDPSGVERMEERSGR